MLQYLLYGGFEWLNQKEICENITLLKICCQIIVLTLLIDRE